MKAVDVVVYGVGPAGLITAILLAKTGMETIVIDPAEERRPDRWAWNNGTLPFDNFSPLVPGLAEGEPMATILSDLGLPIDLMRRKGTDFFPLEVPIQILFPDGRMDFHTDAGMFVKEVERLFPGEAKGFASFFKDSSDLQTEIVQALMHYPTFFVEGWAKHFPERAFAKRFPALEGIRKVSFGEFTSQYFRDPGLTQAMDCLCRHLTGRGADGPLFFGLAALGLLRKRLWYLGGGTDALRQTLGTYLVKHSGRGIVKAAVVSVEAGKGTPTVVTTSAKETYRPQVALVIDQPAAEARQLLRVEKGGYPLPQSRIMQYRAADLSSRPAAMAPVVLAPPDPTGASTSPIEVYSAPAEDVMRSTESIRPLTITWAVPPSKVPFAGPVLATLWSRLYPFTPEATALVQDVVAPHHPFPPPSAPFPAPWDTMGLSGKERLVKGAPVFLVGRDAFPGGNLIFEALSALRIVAELGRTR